MARSRSTSRSILLPILWCLTVVSAHNVLRVTETRGECMGTSRSIEVEWSTEKGWRYHDASYVSVVPEQVFSKLKESYDQGDLRLDILSNFPSIDKPYYELSGRWNVTLEKGKYVAMMYQYHSKKVSKQNHDLKETVEFTVACSREMFEGILRAPRSVFQSSEGTTSIPFVVVDPTRVDTSTSITVSAYADTTLVGSTTISVGQGVRGDIGAIEVPGTVTPGTVTTVKACEGRICRFESVHVTIHSNRTSGEGASLLKRAYELKQCQFDFGLQQLSLLPVYENAIRTAATAQQDHSVSLSEWKAIREAAANYVIGDQALKSAADSACDLTPVPEFVYEASLGVPELSLSTLNILENIFELRDLKREETHELVEEAAADPSDQALIGLQVNVPKEKRSCGSSCISHIRHRSDGLKGWMGKKTSFVGPLLGYSDEGVGGGIATFWWALDTLMIPAAAFGLITGFTTPAVVAWVGFGMTARAGLPDILTMISLPFDLCAKCCGKCKRSKTAPHDSPKTKDQATQVEIKVEDSKGGSSGGSSGSGLEGSKGGSSGGSSGSAEHKTVLLEETELLQDTSTLSDNSSSGLEEKEDDKLTVQTFRVMSRFSAEDTVQSLVEASLLQTFDSLKDDPSTTQKLLDMFSSMIQRHQDEKPQISMLGLSIEVDSSRLVDYRNAIGQLASMARIAVTGQDEKKYYISHEELVAPVLSLANGNSHLSVELSFE